MVVVMSPRLSEETGRVLGGRYRLVAPVGVGTSSRVFLAVDTQLRRRVAVKLLHEALAEDEAFLRRFRAEARAASALSHPNILAVFDWGEDRADGIVVPYLVTEYLGGGSLRNVLDRGDPLTPSQTLVVGLDAARALAHAHQRGLVHRDVKPANLLFDEDGRLRLADFGLARALAEASWTEPTGIAVGTARYASPEQALGRRLDGRSDVYSLALVLVECVTGAVPFSGDTTAATLALRTQGDLELGPELGGLRSVLERAGRLDPDERPEAAEFEIGLMAAAEELERPEPLPIVPTLGDGEQTSELHLIAGLGGISLLDPETGIEEWAPTPDPRVVDTPPPRVVDPADPVVTPMPLEPAGPGPAGPASSEPASAAADPDATDPVLAAPDTSASVEPAAPAAADQPAALDSTLADHGGRGARAAGRLPADVVRSGRPPRGHPGPGPRPLRPGSAPQRTGRTQGRCRSGQGCRVRRTSRRQGSGGGRTVPASGATRPSQGTGRAGGAGAARRSGCRLVVPDPGPRPRRAGLPGRGRRSRHVRGRGARLDRRRQHRGPPGRHRTG